MKPLIPMFYFPLRLLFIDDDIDLLESYSHIDIPNKISIESNPLRAIDTLINNNIEKLKIFTDITDEHDISPLSTENESIVKFAFANIQNLINNKDKYDKYGIAIIDYKMPIMNGIEVCEKLNEKIDIMKILLTGEYQPIEALTAVNEHKAENYIPKGSPSTITDLTAMINELQLKYFISLTKNYSNVLNDKFKFLFDHEFTDLFTDLKNNNNIGEYYLLNNTGCFLFKNSNSNLLLNIYTDEDLETFCEMYSYLDENLINQVKLRKLIPNFKILNYADIYKLFYPSIKAGKYYYSLTRINDFNDFVGL